MEKDLPTGQRLIHLGFSKIKTIRRILESHPGLTSAVRRVGSTADPDLTILQLARLEEVGVSVAALEEALGATRFNRLLHLLGGSKPLGDYLLNHRDDGFHLELSPTPRRDLLVAVGANPEAEIPIAQNASEGVAAFRTKYRQLLTAIAADDLAAQGPEGDVRLVGARLSQLADAALEAALALARAVHDPTGSLPLEIIALGKSGARELNYLSDVDVMFLTESGTTATDLQVATDMIRTLTRYCSAAGPEPALWKLDAGLRPEGRAGPLLRTVGSANDYYERWAHNWEFQALLKARPAAGSTALGEEFITGIEPLVWSSASRPGFIGDFQKMRRLVENSVPTRDKQRELKLGPGGLRDVEFTVQLLQLVHGQQDPLVRQPGTLDAVDALALRGYLARRDAHRLADSYRFLRVVEHRIQLQEMRRTHSLPTAKDALRALGRAVDPVNYSSPSTFENFLLETRRQVRNLQEDVYFRPIVEATATLAGNGDERLTWGATAERLTAIGYVDAEGAARNITELTRGTSRRAMIQRNLSPVIIQWLSEGADPDGGVLSFRILSEQIGDSHWYLALLRDSPVAARRLCRVLANSGWAVGALAALPEAVAWLDDDKNLRPRSSGFLREEVRSLMTRHQDADVAMRRAQSVLSREVTRAGLADITVGLEAWRPSMAEAVDITVEAALRLSLRKRVGSMGGEEINIVAIGMGSYGALESSYPSDVDLMFVHRCLPGVSEAQGMEAATWVVNQTKSFLEESHQETMMSVDLDLRPEGRVGAVSRTIESYREYYARWAAPWEKLALLRARLVGGETALARETLEMIDHFRWKDTPTATELRDLRLMKARMENERLPRGMEPAANVKLGPGGRTDVEWTIQLFQLLHGREFPTLRGKSTLPVLQQLVELEFLSEGEGMDLKRAWVLAGRIRAANSLSSNQLIPTRADVLPRQPNLRRCVANLLGFGVDGGEDLVQAWRFAARRARTVMDRHFWDNAST